jgi:2-hydroxy-3-oxopropionate reductase
MKKIGFIGLGTMGRPMALNLLAAGYQVSAHDVFGVPDDVLAAGGAACTSGREVAQASEIIIVMVPDTPHVESVLFGDNGVASGLAGSVGKIVVDMSSISPLATKTFARRVEQLGASYLDAPVSGGEVGAKAATLSIMVGGTQEAFEAVLPVFQKLGKNITHVGESGAGQTTKVANQIIVALTIEAVAEALLFASKAGADPARVRQALMGGFASSRILELHGERMVSRQFQPGFRIELHQKDLGLALQAARELHVSLPNTAGTQELMNMSAGNGHAKLDHSALILALELMAGHTIGERTS